MKIYGNCLVLVADGERARLFEERRRAGPLAEVSSQLGDLSPSGPMSSGHSGRVFDRFGHSSHTTGGPGPREKREKAFIKRLAERIDAIAASGDFDELVVMAPPHALGQLRQAFKPGTARRLKAAEPHNRLDCLPEEIAAVLRDLRLRSDATD